MSGTNVKLVKQMVKPPDEGAPRIETITPAIAMGMLDRNKLNRPLRQGHVERIANQIRTGKWRYNGDTIKIADTQDVLDGQHRLWAIIEAGQPVQTIVVRGIARDAFSTIDTIRQARSAGDVVALHGRGLYRNAIAAALAWLLRWQRGVLETYRAPENRIENSDIEAAFGDHPGLVLAIERCMPLRRLGNPALLGVLYYVVSNRDEDLAERFRTTLEDPASAALSDPIFRFRSYLTVDHHRQKDPVMTLALGVKALNAAAAGKRIDQLSWRRQGRVPESFPVLDA